MTIRKRLATSLKLISPLNLSRSKTAPFNLNLEPTMNAVAKIAEPTDLALVLVEESQALAVLQNGEKFDAFYERAKAWADAIVPDVTTAKGREEIKSAAFKVTKTKTFIDAARKKLTEDARKQVDAANAAGRKIWDRLEALAVEVRAPLTAWEEAEKERVAKCEVVLSFLRSAAVVGLEDSAIKVELTLNMVKATEIDPAVFQEYTDVAKQNAAHAIEVLTAAGVRIAREEDDRAELARLRAAEEQRQRFERASAELAERADQIRDYIKQVGMGFIGGQTYPYVILIRELQEKIVIDDSYGEHAAELKTCLAETLARVLEAFERDQAEASERVEREVADKARRDAELAAEERAAAKDRAHADALAAEKRRADEAETARKAEADRVAKAEAERTATAKREADEQAKREANKAHQGRVMAAAKAAFMGLGVGEATAKTIVLAIKAGEVPAVSIKF